MPVGSKPTGIFRLSSEGISMAVYDYRCTSCDNVFEVTHGMTEHPEVTCPACGQPATKVFSANGIKFEGSGFYNTDQRGSGPSPATTGSASCGCDNCPHKEN